MARTPAASADANFGNLRYHKGLTVERLLSLVGPRLDDVEMVLDIGANRGGFVHALVGNASHPSRRVIAVEPDERMVRSYAGLPDVELVVDRFEQVRLPVDHADLVINVHTLEHVTSPLAMLRACRSFVDPGGEILLEVPNVDDIEEPNIVEEFFIDKHTFHFSPATFERLLRTVGLVPRKSAYDSGYLAAVLQPSEPLYSPLPDQAEVERVRELVGSYSVRLATNRHRLRSIVERIRAYEAHRVAVWGAGRIFDALATAGGMRPDEIAVVVDRHLPMSQHSGFTVERPERLMAYDPDLVVVCSREYAGQICEEARALLGPDAPLITFEELMSAEEPLRVQPVHRVDIAVKANAIRVGALEMIHNAGSGHPGGSLSCADILAVLYFAVMRVHSEEPSWEERDRLVLSKGHGCPALYAALAERGYFARGEFQRFRSLGGLLQGHPEVNIPGIDAPSGSLGMGLSQGMGMALAARHLVRPFQTYVILGDGDMQEGNTWEAMMAASFHRLGSLTAILDANGRQGDNRVEHQMDYEPIVTKVAAFGWDVCEIDGHDLDAIGQALKRAHDDDARPSFIVARTLKGKGVSFMEDEQYWHGSVPISVGELARARQELLASVG